MNSKEIGVFLASIRKEKKLTQTDLAQILNVTHQAISRWETGESIPDINSLCNIAKFYNITIDEIINAKLNNKVNIDINSCDSDNVSNTYEKALIKFKKNNVTSLAIALLSIVLFFGIILTTYYEIIGFTVQLVLLITSGVIFLFGLHEFDFSSKNLLSIKDNDLYISSVKYQKLFSMITFSVFIIVITLPLPYIVLDNRNFVKAIITVKTYFKYIIYFILLAGVIGIYILSLIDKHYMKKAKVIRSIKSFVSLSRLKEEHKRFYIFLKNFLYFPIVLYMIIFSIDSSKSFIIVITILLSFLMLSDLFCIIKYKKYTNVLRIIISLICVFEMFNICDYEDYIYLIFFSVVYIIFCIINYIYKFKKFSIVVKVERIISIFLTITFFYCLVPSIIEKMHESYTNHSVYYIEYEKAKVGVIIYVAIDFICRLILYRIKNRNLMINNNINE